ncbi:metabotropic glutamate receptor [Linepithema humile]|uniref:metabotropic glutamate receptor n=1 Tax=Linepithema humile TaxID=83485 RepID=UPI0006236216|nr:PREDICTED: metabotropic glutamate receptor [Linepithema humile]XP_012230285.1 PREDICTED: metabotropic glutamate receptor [Linepithema humile]XP_012230286.1 PREDICTED: metabotropic glutamate receptor [Linepithema humile]XP_012230287.1 PREDICTED: metabotropic glutamate receptor [Linepithema humile]XP_012230288.1 PREDICTED: metabotropic glutamate receptor [Linepithema humile]XP_012230289.1 PREDICTED: metabotropic glutamate receptor [Linepithema humile]
MRQRVPWPLLLVILSLRRLSTLQSRLHSEAVLIPGDIVLGGLFPVHEKGGGTACGPSIYHRGVQRLEAMLFAVDEINRNETILPDVTLGVHILDTCGRDTYALNQSLHFVRASLSNIDISVLECADKSTPRVKRTASAGPIFGVVGGSYSSVSLQVANLLRLFHIPQISPASTAKALSDKTRFDYFARTVPPDTFQSIALVDVVKSANWSYVSTVYSEGSYGEYGIEVFTREATERNVCIAAALKVPSAANDKVFDDIIQRLSKKPNARAIVLFTRAEDARGILEAARRSNLSQPFQWLASDGWGRQSKLVEGLEEEAEGAITVELHSEHIPHFDKYMASLTPLNNRRNPWFGEYWEEVFGCTLQRNRRWNGSGNQSLTFCSSDLRLTQASGYEQESKVQFVVDAVYAFALALNNLRADLCGRHTEGLCSSMANYDRGVFYRNYLLNVSFVDAAGSEVKFDEHGDGLARYEILNFRKGTNNNGANGYHYRVVGKWYNSLDIRTEEMVWARGTKDIPISACSLPCEPGMIKKQQGDTCCWVCDQCEAYEFVYDEYTCMDCGPGLWPHPDKRGCYQLPIKHIRWSSAFAIAPAIISCLGIVATLAVACLLFQHRDTPVVRASGRELTVILLAGVLVCYLNTFVLLATPTTAICVLQRFGVGVSFSAIYGALLTKTNRIARIFDSASRSAVRLRYISPTSQVCIAAALIAFQVVLTLVWMIVEPPGTRYWYPDRREVILKCNIQDMSFLFSQLYNALLILISTVYAVKTRKIPENFNESKFIGFTMYTTCIIWLAFVPIYFGTGNAHETQITTLCVAISLSASVTLVCLYSPKVYIIVFQPDKNIRGKVYMGSTFKKQCSSAGASSLTKYTGELASESVPLQGALTVAVQTSVGVTEISLTSNTTTNDKPNNEQVAQL